MRTETMSIGEFMNPIQPIRKEMFLPTLGLLPTGLSYFSPESKVIYTSIILLGAVTITGAKVSNKLVDKGHAKWAEAVDAFFKFGLWIGAFLAFMYFLKSVPFTLR
jgi:hypothetical protein